MPSIPPRGGTLSSTATAVNSIDSPSDRIDKHVPYLEDQPARPYQLSVAQVLAELEVDSVAGLSEGQATDSLGQIQDFMGQATSYMESQDWVEYYCWFGAMHDMQNVNPLNQLMASDGGLTDLGRQFLSS